MSRNDTIKTIMSPKPSAKTTKPTASEPFAFEPALQELEDITAWFEAPDVDLDLGLAKFERGMELATQLKEHLGMVENRIDRIKQRFEAPVTAQAETEPESDPATDQTGLF